MQQRGISEGGWVWVNGAENDVKAKVKALVTERVGKGVAFMPFHFGGWFRGEDFEPIIPKGPTLTFSAKRQQYPPPNGYDPVTGCRNRKVTLARSLRVAEERRWHG